MDGDPVYIVTLKLDRASFERVQALRAQHFPSRLNWIPAHLTLLHRLSGAQVARLAQGWHAMAGGGPLSMHYTGPKSLGRGVAIAVDAPQVGRLRDRVMEAAGGPFSRQDLQPFRAHVTVQNKVEPAAAAALLRSLEAGFEPWSGRAEGVLIWRYLGGPWELESELVFQAAGD